MKDKIHPKYYPEARVICACGNEWVTGSTQEVLRTDVCSVCHPFFTGQQRIVDVSGHVDRFRQRVERSRQLQTEAERREAQREERRRARTLVEVVDEEEAVEPIEALFENTDEEQE
ncbi:MAG TPA: 50S ribosomal protein L31 [Chloroflexi bacterium]|nr:50S ribosomal protein L31 [Chloroflexota bacterium]